MNNTILITGGAGFIGSALAEGFAQNPACKIIVIDDLSTGSLKKLPLNKYPNIEFVKCDVNNYNDISAIMLNNKFDYVFHYAAVVGVQRTLKNPIKVLNDINGIKNILELSKNTGVKRFFYSSSSEVYGEPIELPQNEETTPLNSKLPYAIVKNVGEALIKAYKKEYNLDYTIFRLFNTYGPNQSADFVIAKFINNAIKHKDISIYGDGKQARTFFYIEDHVNAVIKALKEEQFINEIINIGSDNVITIIDLAKRIIKLTKSKSQIIHLPALEEGDMRSRQPDISKLKKLVHDNFISLDEGICKILMNK